MKIIIRKPIDNEEKENNPWGFIAIIIIVIVATYFVVSFVVNKLNQ